MVFVVFFAFTDAFACICAGTLGDGVCSPAERERGLCGETPFGAVVEACPEPVNGNSDSFGRFPRITRNGHPFYLFVLTQPESGQTGNIKCTPPSNDVKFIALKVPEVCDEESAEEYILRITKPGKLIDDDKVVWRVIEYYEKAYDALIEAECAQCPVQLDQFRFGFVVEKDSVATDCATALRLKTEQNEISQVDVRGIKCIDVSNESLRVYAGSTVVEQDECTGEEIRVYDLQDNQDYDLIEDWSIIIPTKKGSIEIHNPKIGTDEGAPLKINPRCWTRSGRLYCR
jgi:hypothetical protein